MRGFSSFISRTSKQLLLLFSNNNNCRSRTSGIINVHPSQTRYWFSTTSSDDVEVEVEVEGRDDELRSISSSRRRRRRVVVDVENTTTNKHQSLLLIPTPPTPCGCVVVVEGEHGKVLQELDDKFPYGKHKEGRNPTPSVVVAAAAAALKRSNYLHKLRTMSKVSNPGPDGQLPANVNYLLDLGFSHDQIKDIVRRHPNFAYRSIEGKIKPFIEFLIELGVPQSDIPRIIFKRPSFCGMSLSTNIVPTMTYLETFGINKSHWAKVIHRFPALLTYSRQKIKACVDFFAELGLSEEATGKILTRCPSIVSCSIEDNLRPTAQFLESLGIRPDMLIQQVPSILGRSVEACLKPKMKFFLDKGFSDDEVIEMISRFGVLYTLSLAKNLEPKWEFFLTLGYDNSELVKRPQYFSYSLEGRIKPRFSRMASCGLRASLSSVLGTTDLMFEELIQKKLKKVELLSQKRDCC